MSALSAIGGVIVGASVVSIQQSVNPQVWVLGILAGGLLVVASAAFEFRTLATLPEPPAAKGTEHE